MHVLRSLVFYPVYYVGSALCVIMALVGFLLGPRPFRTAVSDWGAWHRWCLRHILGIRVVVEGGGPRDAPMLYAIKHESFFEALDAPYLFTFPAVFAKKELFSIPVWGYLGRRYGLVPVARNEGAKALMMLIREARGFAAEGRPLVIFPEGTRTPHGQRGKLQSGFSGLYKMVGLPVMPVAVNSGPLYHRLWKRSGTITYRFGEPIPAGLPREEIERRTQEAINVLNPG